MTVLDMEWIYPKIRLIVIKNDFMEAERSINMSDFIIVSILRRKETNYKNSHVLGCFDRALLNESLAQFVIQTNLSFCFVSTRCFTVQTEFSISVWGVRSTLAGRMFTTDF